MSEDEKHPHNVTLISIQVLLFNANSFICLFVDILMRADMLKHVLSVEHPLSVHVEVIIAKVKCPH